LTARKAVIVVEKRVDSLKVSPQSGGVGVSRQENAMKGCARCNWGLTTLSGKVNVRIIVLLSFFDRTKGLDRGEKAGRQS